VWRNDALDEHRYTTAITTTTIIITITIIWRD
jgi:hypothetical protein